MARANFIIIENNGPLGVAVAEATGAVTGTNPAPGSVNNLDINFDGTLVASDFRGFTYNGISQPSLTSDIYIKRGVAGVSPILLAKANGATDMAAYTGYMAVLDTDGTGGVSILRFAAGVPTTVATLPASYVPAAATWYRWRLYVRDFGADCVVKLQLWNGAAWADQINTTDVASPLAGVSGSAGFGVQERVGGSTDFGPVISFDDWRCDQAVA